MAGTPFTGGGGEFGGPRHGWAQVRGTGEPMGAPGPMRRYDREHRGGSSRYDEGWQGARGMRRGYDAGFRTDGPAGGRMRGLAGFGRDLRTPVRRGPSPDFWGDSMRGAGRGYDRGMRIVPRGYEGNTRSAGRGYDASMRRPAAGYDRGMRGGVAARLSDAEFYGRVDRW